MKRVFGLCLFLSLNLAYALKSGEPIHFSGDKEVWDRRRNHVLLKGHASVIQFGETISADEIEIDFNTRLMITKGNSVYTTDETVIWGDEMRFNIDTREGEVVRGRVSTDRFTLRGKLIHRLLHGRLKTQQGEYTTCVDCAPSWTLFADEVDMQTEGYAYFKNVTPRVKDSPIFWFPYLFLPMKTKRQSGVLFPSFSFGSAHGTTFILPYFWAIDRSADMTFYPGYYTSRGARLQVEGRYALTYGSATGNYYWNQDRSFSKQFGLGDTRWGFNLTQRHLLPGGIQQRLLFSEVGDAYYPYYFPEMKVGSDVFLTSSLQFTKAAPSWGASLWVQRHRNLLRTDGIADPSSTLDDSMRRLTLFDPRAVQVLPRVDFFLVDRPLLTSGLYGGFNFSFVNFSRGGNWFDYDNQSVRFGTSIPGTAPSFSPGIDPIREAMRFSFTPTVYTHWRPWDRFSLIPSLQYRNYFYHFNGRVNPLYRSYLLFQTDLVTQIEKIYEFSEEDDKVSRAKHLFRPYLTYSLIPDFSISGEDRGPTAHPFMRQIHNSGQLGYNFDNYDITPLNTTQNAVQYFNPLGHSLGYGLTSQWIQKFDSGGPMSAPTYRKAVDFKAGQVINFRELTNPADPKNPHPWARFTSELGLFFGRWNSNTSYNYLADQNIDGPGVSNPNVVDRHQISTSFGYSFESALKDGILIFDRSVNLGYVYSGQQPFASNISLGIRYSISDYLLPSISLNYQLPLSNAGRPGVDPAGAGSKFLGATAGLMIQSPSRCWKIAINANYSPGIQNITYVPDFSINLLGTGFGTVGSYVEQAGQGSGS